MDLATHIKSAISNIKSSKLRSMLTILGVLVGTGSVVALVSGGQLATEQALAQFKELGTNLMSINLQPAKPGGEGDYLNVDDLPILEKTDPGIIAAAGYSLGFEPISFQGQTIQGSTVGADQKLAQVLKIKLQNGRFVSNLDTDQRFGVIGNSIATELKTKGYLNPVGEQILVGTTYFTIVGVLEPTPHNFFLYVDLNESVIIPLISSLELSTYTHMNDVIFTLREGTDPVKVEAALTKKVNELVLDTKVYPRDSQQLISGMQAQHQTFTILLGFIGGISLLVGGIGVMNIMLVSVIERRREIGVRMAIGAKQFDIRSMFLTEAVLLCVFGGILGIIVGVLASYITARISNWSFQIFLTPPLIGFFVSVFVGMFFGYYPAYRASKMDPIACLTEE